MPGYEKDRHSRMPASSVNASNKKDGGGAFNWGGADPNFTSYASTQEIPNTVTIGAAPVMMAQPVQSYTLQAHDKLAFPALGPEIPGARPIVQQVVRWPPPKYDLTSDALRPGSVQLFDANHPRNAFAPKPYVVHQAAQPPVQMAVDWSQDGTPQDLARQIIRGGGGVAHAAPFARPQAAPVRLTQQMLVSSMGAQPAVYAPPVNSGYKPQIIRQVLR